MVPLLLRYTQCWEQCLLMWLQGENRTRRMADLSSPLFLRYSTMEKEAPISFKFLYVEIFCCNSSELRHPCPQILLGTHIFVPFSEIRYWSHWRYQSILESEIAVYCCISFFNFVLYKWDKWGLKWDRLVFIYTSIF